MYSTVTGAIVPIGGLDAEYWWRNVREPVQFAPTIDRLIEDRHQAFIELGPHPIHATAIGELLEKREVEGVVVPSLHRKQSDRVSLLTSLASLYAAGLDPDWDALFDGIPKRAEVPLYPWQRETYWLESQSSRSRRFPPLRHPLVGIEKLVADERAQTPPPQKPKKTGSTEMKMIASTTFSKFFSRKVRNLRNSPSSWPKPSAAPPVPR